MSRTTPLGAIVALSCWLCAEPTTLAGEVVGPRARRATPLPAYQAAHDALWSHTKTLIQQKASLRAQLRDPQSPSAAQQLEDKLAATGVEAAQVSLALKALRGGSAIGQVVRKVNGEIAAREKHLKKLSPKLSLRERFRGLRGKGGQERAATPEQRRLANEITGLRRAAASLVDSAPGRRGDQVAPELGLQVVMPLVGHVAARVGVQVNGPDTGLARVRPYLRLGAGAQLGLATGRGTLVMGAKGLNTGYLTGGVNSPFGGADFTPHDPVVGGRKISLRAGPLITNLTDRGYEVGGGVPILPFIATATVLFQGPNAKTRSQKIRSSGPVARARKSSPAIDAALSNDPPSTSTLLEMFKAERAAAKAAKAARRAPRDVTRDHFAGP